MGDDPQPRTIPGPATTLKFTDTTLKSVEVSDTVFLASGVDRNKGKVIGYSTVRGELDEDDDSVEFTAAIALKGGLIYLTVTVEDGDDAATGEVTGGTGKYEDATGTVRVRDLDDGDDDVSVRITYRT